MSGNLVNPTDRYNCKACVCIREHTYYLAIRLAIVAA